MFTRYSIFQQDNAPRHSSGKMLTEVPDLNAIEDLWDVLDKEDP